MEMRVGSGEFTDYQPQFGESRQEQQGESDDPEGSVFVVEEELRVSYPSSDDRNSSDEEYANQFFEGMICAVGSDQGGG